MNMTEFKEMIFKATIEGIMKIYGFDKKVSEKLVAESGLDWSIEVAPDMVAHCSQEQLVDMVMG
ncbi:hypothetical protein [Clostridium sp. JN-1]|jgi:hypothetical protein|uniref:hypothetical protein n=1 Tax=Clostridium sp. JN-1 TaxID=2483110 RepID=UPI000F0BC8DD|nr:hypothetical protein [Clostridium sp. JN-1]